MNLPDIDIDFADRKAALKYLEHIPACIEEGKIHNSGVYFTDIPYDPLNHHATIDYERAEELGYFKVDFLNVSVYKLVQDEEHLVTMMSKEPPWQRLWEEKNFCDKIVHISNQYKLICQLKPDSIPRMAMFLSVIRPGKRHLIGKPWKEIGETVWEKTEEGYYFKKAHAVSYAHLVALHMNLVDEDVDTNT